VFLCTFLLDCSVRVLSSCKITPNEFLVSVTFPIASVWYGITRRQNRNNNGRDLIETYHLLSIIQKPYNTYQDGGEQREKTLIWQPVIAFRGLCLATIPLFLNYPFFKLISASVLFLVFVIQDLLVRPYRDKYLNIVNFVSWTLLYVLIMFNGFWTLTGLMDVDKSTIFTGMGLVFLCAELIVLASPLIYLVGYTLKVLFLTFIYKKILNKHD